MSGPAVTRWIRGFDKSSEQLKVEHRLPSEWTVERLRNIFGLPDDDPMYECYPIGEILARSIEASLGVPLNSREFDFFLEADAEPP